MEAYPAAAAAVEAPADETPADDQYADIRDRIKARAAELDLRATAPKEVFQTTEQKNFLTSMVDTAVEDTLTTRLKDTSWTSSLPRWQL